MLVYIVTAAAAQKQLPAGRSVSYYLSKGGRLLETGDYATAILYLEAALRAPRRGVKPAVIELTEKLLVSARIYEQARIAREAGRIEEAVEKYCQIMAINPIDPKPLEFISEVYDYATEGAEKAGQYEEAARLYAAWMKFHPSSELPRQGYIRNLKRAAEAAVSEGKTDLAIKFYVLLVTADPSDETNKSQLRSLQRSNDIKNAQALISSGKLTEAITELTRLTTVYPKDEEIEQLLKMTRGQRELELAERAFSKYNYHAAYGYYKRALADLPEQRSKIAERLREIEQRTGANYASDGFIILKGKATKPAKIVIRADKVETTEGVTVTLGGKGLPERAYTAKVRNAVGDIRCEILDRPSMSNGYALALGLWPGKDKDFTLEVDWKLASSGTIFWEGEIEKTARIRLQGPYVDTSGAQRVSWSGDPLPHAAYELKIELAEASTAKVELLEAPSTENDYATTVSISAVRQQVKLQLTWKLVD